MTPVVSPSFCFPHPHDLEFSRKKRGGKFGVNDANGNLIFQVQESVFSFHEKRVILDAAGLPILTLREKRASMHSRWKVFRGESTDDKDLIFSARRSSMFQMKNKVHVFLANNTSEEAFDYTVRGSWPKRSCKVYARDSSTLVAQMHKGKHKFMVRVFPNIDHVFIVALIVILDEINSSSDDGGGDRVDDGGGDDGDGGGGGDDGGGGGCGGGCGGGGGGCGGGGGGG